MTERSDARTSAELKHLWMLGSNRPGVTRVSRAAGYYDQLRKRFARRDVLAKEREADDWPDFFGKKLAEDGRVTPPKRPETFGKDVGKGGRVAPPKRPETFGKDVGKGGRVASPKRPDVEEYRECSGRQKGVLAACSSAIESGIRTRVADSDLRRWLDFDYASRIYRRLYNHGGWAYVCTDASGLGLYDDDEQDTIWIKKDFWGGWLEALPQDARQRIRESIVIHEAVHLVDYQIRNKLGFRPRADKFPRFKSPATEYNAAFVQAKWLGGDNCNNCEADAFAKAYCLKAGGELDSVEMALTFGALFLECHAKIAPLHELLAGFEAGLNPLTSGLASLFPPLAGLFATVHMLLMELDLD